MSRVCRQKRDAGTRDPMEGTFDLNLFKDEYPIFKYLIFPMMLPAFRIYDFFELTFSDLLNLAPSLLLFRLSSSDRR
jgi:hypothetical protein